MHYNWNHSLKISLVKYMTKNHRCTQQPDDGWEYQIYKLWKVNEDAWHHRFACLKERLKVAKTVEIINTERCRGLTTVIDLSKMKLIVSAIQWVYTNIIVAACCMDRYMASIGERLFQGSSNRPGVRRENRKHDQIYPNSTNFWKKNIYIYKVVVLVVQSWN